MFNSTLEHSSKKDGTISQKEILFNRGNAMSGAPTMIGTNQLPKPPISPGYDDKENHDQTMRGNEDVPLLAVLHILQTGIGQLKAHDDGQADTDQSGKDRKN